MIKLSGAIANVAVAPFVFCMYAIEKQLHYYGKYDIMRM